MTAQEIMRLPDTTLLAFHRDNWPMRLTRLEWYRHPILAKRRAIAPPKLSSLPQLDQTSDSQDQRNHHASNTNTLWQSNRKLPNGYTDQDKRY